MKLAWAVFWRVFVLLLAFSVVAVLPFRETAFITQPQFFVWKPPALWCGFAVLLLLVQALRSNGLVHLLWGKRLGQSQPFWRKLSFATAGLFVGLAVISLILSQVISFEAWAKFKAAAPLAGLLVFALTVPRRLAVEPQPTLQADGPASGGSAA